MTLRLFHDYFSGETTTICYDYCLPLLAIGRKPEKRYGESRQWFRAACRWPCTGGDADPSASALGAALARDPHTVGADPAGLAWSAICCTGWHGSIIGTYPYIYLIIIGGCAELYSVRA